MLDLEQRIHHVEVVFLTTQLKGMSMKKLAVIFAFLSVTNVFAQCANPYGWRKVEEKSISFSERLCIYERNGIRLQIVVNGYNCPASPC